MKNYILVLVLVILTSIALAGCGGLRCTLVETLNCSSNLSSCQASCSNSACRDVCTMQFCVCMDDAGCDKTGDCLKY